MITAYASLETVKNALTHGAFEYLIKPFSRQDLEETARRALARRQAEHGHAQPAHRPRGGDARARQQDPQPRGGERAASRPTSRSASPSCRSSARSPASLLGQLDLRQLTAAITGQLKEALGYDEAAVRLGADAAPGTPAKRASSAPSATRARSWATCVAANRSGARPDRPARARAPRDARPTTSRWPSATRACTARWRRPSSTWSSSSAPRATPSSRSTARARSAAGTRPPSASSA